MATYQLVIMYLGIVLETSLLAAILARRWYETSLSFVLYVVAVLASSVLFGVWPERFYNWDNYFLKEVVHALLKFAIALELGYRTARAFPGAFRAWQQILTIVMLAVAALVLAALTKESSLAGLQVEWHARVLTGTIWLFTALAAVLLWYRLPVDPMHKAILVGFVPYLLVFSLAQRAMAELGLARGVLFQRAHTIAYLLLLSYWNLVAWGSEHDPVATPSSVPRHARAA